MTEFSNSDLKARLAQIQIELAHTENLEKNLTEKLSDEEKELIAQNRVRFTDLVIEANEIENILDKKGEKVSIDELKQKYSSIKELLADSKPREASDALEQRAKRCWTRCVTCISCTTCITNSGLRPNEHFCYPAGSREYICNPKSETTGQYENGKIEDLKIKWNK